MAWIAGTPGTCSDGSFELAVAVGERSSAVKIDGLIHTLGPVTRASGDPARNSNDKKTTTPPNARVATRREIQRIIIAPSSLSVLQPEHVRAFVSMYSMHRIISFIKNSLTRLGVCLEPFPGSLLKPLGQQSDGTRFGRVVKQARRCELSVNWSIAELLSSIIDVMKSLAHRSWLIRIARSAI